MTIDVVSHDHSIVNILISAHMSCHVTVLVYHVICYSSCDLSCDLQTMTDVFLCDLSVLRAMYDNVDGDMTKFMSSTEQ